MYDETTAPMMGLEPLVTSYQDLRCALAAVLPQFVQSITPPSRSLTEAEVQDLTTAVYFRLFECYLHEAHRLATT
jgi:hypothetical protein